MPEVIKCKQYYRIHDEGEDLTEKVMLVLSEARSRAAKAAARRCAEIAETLEEEDDHGHPNATVGQGWRIAQRIRKEFGL